MSNDSGTDLNTILGQLEDELSLVKSAREQVDSVLTANEELNNLTQRSGSELNAAADALAGEVNHLSGCADAILRMSNVSVETIRGQTAESVVTLNQGIDEAKHDLELALKTVEAAATGLDESRTALLEAQKSVSVEAQRQSVETKSLLEATRKQLDEVDERIMTLKSFDVEGLSADVKRLKDLEESNAASIQKQIKTVTALVGICLAFCVAVLVKLLIS